MFGRKSVYGKHVNNTAAQQEKKVTRFNIRKPGYKTRQPQRPGKTIDNFEQEYQKFIADLKAKKAAEDKVEEPVYVDDGETDGETSLEVETKVEEPVDEDNIQTLVPEQPVEESVKEETVVYVPKKRKRIVNENIKENTEEN